MKKSSGRRRGMDAKLSLRQSWNSATKPLPGKRIFSIGC